MKPVRIQHIPEDGYGLKSVPLEIEFGLFVSEFELHSLNLNCTVWIWIAQFEFELHILNLNYTVWNFELELKFCNSNSKLVIQIQNSNSDSKLVIQIQNCNSNSNCEIQIQNWTATIRVLAGGRAIDLRTVHRRHRTTLVWKCNGIKCIIISTCGRQQCAVRHLDCRKTQEEEEEQEDHGGWRCWTSKLITCNIDFKSSSNYYFIYSGPKMAPKDLEQ